MAIRISGLTSGLDTDSIVQELVSAYSTKKENIEKKQTKLSWTQDAWKEMSLGDHMKLYEEQGMNRKDAMKQVAKDRGVGKREIYQALLEEE